MKHIKVFVKSEKEPIIIVDENNNIEFRHEVEFIVFSNKQLSVTFMKNEVKYWLIKEID
ncbi:MULTISPECIES: hypothetical protein [unclassified Empedobacter]|uniref:hypothetical protein n=1 Tax=unclassified Empedobacter TaxID=2643773 RepID=UPI0025BCC860|nr:MULTISPECIES: hypothetical protein [unclassified Empedobacter]